MIACRAVIFDAGNTLIHLDPPSQEVAAMYFHRKGMANSGRLGKLFCRMREIWAGEQSLKELRGAPRMQHDEFIHEMNAAGLQSAIPGMQRQELTAMEEELTGMLGIEREWNAAPDAEHVLAVLAEKGFALAMVSNFTADLADILAALGLRRYFQTVLISEVVGIEKPDPEIMKIACSELNLPPDQCVYVGDHPFDVLCAKEAGMKMVWVRRDGSPLPAEIMHEPDVIVENLDEIPSTVSLID